MIGILPKNSSPVALNKYLGKSFNPYSQVLSKQLGIQLQTIPLSKRSRGKPTKIRIFVMQSPSILARRNVGFRFARKDTFRSLSMVSHLHILMQTQDFQSQVDLFRHTLLYRSKVNGLSEEWLKTTLSACRMLSMVLFSTRINLSNKFRYSLVTNKNQLSSQRSRTRKTILLQTYRQLQ